MDFNLLIGAASYASLLSLMALGLTFTYITMKVPNFAHGDFVAIGGYVAYTLYVLDNKNAHLFLSLPLAFIITGLISYAVYISALKPLSKRNLRIADMMIAFLALEIIIRSLILIYTDVMRAATGTYFTNVMILDKNISMLGYSVPLTFISSISITIALLASLVFFLTKTKTGIALRASMENPQLASTLGINVDKYYSLAWFLAGGITGLTGPIMLSIFPLSPGVGWSYNVRIFASSVLGGLDSLSGAVVGGLIVGITEVIGSYFLSKPPFNIPSVYRVTIPFFILIATILLMPRGAITTINQYMEKRRGEKK
ncbi:MAG: branched-chain amino acid ABC transporter permease [Fervidicoccaceae archaeon]|jgi:branched-chain amino acid transport system permease protein|nr:branched-chain amino acid ABC transporter permease [Fervidicoccaceae archaeon]